MNFEQNIGVTNTSNPTLEARITALEKRLSYLESTPQKVFFGATEYIESNTFTISSTVQEDKSIVLSYDLTGLMTGSDYKVISTDITISGLDKNGNTAKLTTTTNTKSTITLQPHNFPVTASIRAIVVKDGVQKTLYRAANLETPNFGAKNFYLSSLITQASKKEMTVEEALNYLLTRLESIK